MFTANPSLPSTVSSPNFWLRALFSRLWAFNRFLTLALLFYVALIPIYVIAAIVDPRLITNAPAFVKPLKFVLSITIYLGTFVWLLTWVQGKRWWLHLLGNITAWGLTLEIVLVTVQAIRGVPSHFNQTTAYDEIVFAIMGMTIVIVALMNLILAIGLLFQHLPDPVFAWGLRLGLLIALVGMLLGFLMTGTPSQAQAAQMEAGASPNAFGAHSVGVEDGGPGLPFVGWSTVGGDLRVPHFVGLHSMQVLPLLAFALSRRRSLSQRQRLALLFTGGLAYLGWIALLTWQALRGQSVIALDALTLSAYGGLLAIVALAISFTLIRRRQPSMASAHTQPL